MALKVKKFLTDEDIRRSPQPRTLTDRDISSARSGEKMTEDQRKLYKATGKKSVVNKDFSGISSERTITREIDGKYYNIPTVVGGVQLSAKEATRRVMQTGKHGGSFDSLQKAVTAAENRSRELDRLSGGTGVLRKSPKSSIPSAEPKKESGLKKFAKDLYQYSFKEPAMEAYKGLQEGTAQVYGDLARASKVLDVAGEKIGWKKFYKTHVEPKIGIPYESKFFKSMEKTAAGAAAAVPETATGKTIPGKIFRGMGTAAPIIGEYALPAKYLKSAPAAFGMVEAFKHIDEDPKSIAGHAAKGALMGGVLQGAQYLPLLARMPAVGGVFASETALQKGSPEDIAATFFVGAGLAIPGRIGTKGEYMAPFRAAQYKIKQKQTEAHLKRQAASAKEVFDIMGADPEISPIQIAKMSDFVMKPENLGRTSPEGMAAAKEKALQRLRDYENKQAVDVEAEAPGRPRTASEKSVIRQMEKAIINDKTATPKEIQEAVQILNKYKAAEEAIILDPRPSAQQAEQTVIELEAKNHDQRDPETGFVIKNAEPLSANEVEVLEMSKHALDTGEVKPSQGDVIVQAQEEVKLNVKKSLKRERKITERGPIKKPTTVLGEVRRQGGFTMKSLKAAGYTWQDIKEFGLMSAINNKTGMSFDALANSMKEQGIISIAEGESPTEAFMKHLKEKTTSLYEKTAKELDNEYQRQEQEWLERRPELEGELDREVKKFDELDRVAQEQAQSEFIQETGGEDAQLTERELAERTRAEAEYEGVVKAAKKKSRRKALMGKVKKASELATLEEHFTPGKIVKSYFGYDKVLEFKGGKDWQVKVISVNADGTPIKGELPRWHSTHPGQKVLARTKDLQRIETRKKIVAETDITPSRSAILETITKEWKPKDEIEAQELMEDGLLEYFEMRKAGKSPSKVLGRKLTKALKGLFEKIWQSLKSVALSKGGFIDFSFRKKPIKGMKPKKVSDLLRELKEEQAGKPKKATFKDLYQEATYKAGQPGLQKHIDYLQDIQLPKTSKIESIKSDIARLNGLRLANKITPHEANKRIHDLRVKLLETGHFEGVAIRQTKGGRYQLAIRKTGIYVPKEFADYKEFKNKPFMAGGGTDVINTILEIDSAKSVKDLTKMPEQTGPMWKYVGRRYQDISLQRMQYANEAKLGLIKDLAETGFIKSQRKIVGSELKYKKNFTEKENNQVYDLLDGKEVKGASDRDMKLRTINPTIATKKRESTFKVLKATTVFREFFDRLINEQNVVRELRNQDPVPYRKDYITHTLKSATVWERLGFATQKAEDIMGPALPDFINPNKPFNPRELARRGGMDKFMRDRDVLRLAHRYTDTAAADIHNTTIIQNNKAFADQLDSMGYGESAKWLRHWTSVAFAGMEPGLAKWMNMPKVRRVASKFNAARNLAVFSFNLSWVPAVQTASYTTLTTTRSGFRNALMGIFDWMNPENREMVRALSYIYRQKTEAKGGKFAYQDISNVLSDTTGLTQSKMEKARDFATWHISSMESMLTGMSFFAGFRNGQQRGLKGRALLDFASNEAARTQTMYNKEDRPGLLNEWMVQTLAPYQSYNFQFANLIREFAGKTGTPPDDKADMAARILRLIAGVALANYIHNAVRGGDLNDIENASVPFKNLWYAPVIEALMKGKTARLSPMNLVPPASFMVEMMQGLGEWTKNGDIQPFRKWAVKWVPAAFGIPSGNQANKVVDAMVAYLQHGKEETDRFTGRTEKYGRVGKYKIKYEDVPVIEQKDGSLLVKTYRRKYRTKVANWDQFKEVFGMDAYHEARQKGEFTFGYPMFSEKFRFHKNEIWKAMFSGVYSTRGGREYIAETIEEKDKPKVPHLRQSFRKLLN